MGRHPPQLGDPARVIAVVFGCAPEDVAEDVVLSPFIPLGAFRRYLDDGDGVALAPDFFYRGFTAHFRSRPVTIIATGVGPSRVGDCVGFLSLTPARRVVFVGAVGGLAADHRIGDFFVPTEAADGEGFTRYVDSDFGNLVRTATRYPCAAADGGIRHFLEMQGCAVHAGRVFTIGSIAFETEANLRAVAAAGYDAVEMELSAFYASARHYGLAAEALTYVSDLPLRRDLWSERTVAETEALRRAYRAAPRLALELLQDRCGAPAVPCTSS